jgi:phosphocarrier protein
VGAGDGESQVQRAERAVVITNKRGMYISAAAKFVELANQYACEVRVEKDGREVNGKSIMGVLMLVASKGSTITIKAMGEFANEAVSALALLVAGKFDEAE